MKIFLNAFVLLCIAGYCRAQKFTPSLNLVKGNTYYYSTNATSAVVQTISGQQNALNLGITFKMAFKVVGIADTVYQMEVSYQTLVMKIDVAGNSLELSSQKNDPQDIPSSIMAAMMNKPFNLDMTKTGRILSVQNIDKMISGTVDNFPGADAAKKAQVKEQLLQSFGPEAFKGNIEQGTAIFPYKPVAKNETWSVTTHLSSPAKASVIVNYTLADVAEGQYIIHGDGSMATEKDSGTTQISGMPVKYDLHGTMISDIRVDKTTGWINEVKMKQVFMGDMKILDNPQVPGGMSIPMTFNSDVVTTNK
ncbi:MAG TPA: DUF6263 family protein [Mucilaginibacter sp.]